ncbi:MAG: nodulation protein NodH [Albidovulum sp.]
MDPLAQRFDYFVILAEMRTGSNLLEATLAEVPDLHLHGEVYNPDYIGAPKNKDVLGVTMADRLAEPEQLLHRIRDADGLNGFRFFFDHEPRVIDAILTDPRCAKIVLTRNPVDCYISLKIAYNTKRWQLTNVKDKIAWKPPFKPAEFEAFLAERQAFQVRLLNTLQITGQTAFYADYEDTLRPDVLNGMLQFLGVEGQLEKISTALIRQNPEEMSDKVRNFPEMEEALAQIDWAGLARTPCFEPRRGPGVPRIVAAEGAPLLFLPITPGTDGHLRDWLAGLGKGGLIEGFNQKNLRAWKRKARGHRSFTVLHHPVDRANEVFAAVLMRDGFSDIRPSLRNHYGVPIPIDEDISKMTLADYRAALLAFMGFVKVNLNGQTGTRQDLIWASQWSILNGIAQFASPDLLCRADRLFDDLTYLAKTVGLKTKPPTISGESLAPFPTQALYGDDLESAVNDAWRRDYMTFGFGRWSA